MERILLAADYPNLTELKLFNFESTIVSLCFTDESSSRRVLQRQITDLILIFEKDFDDISVEDYTTDVYGYILKFFENLKHLSIIGSYSHDFPSLELRNLPLTTFFSSTLNKFTTDRYFANELLCVFESTLMK